MTRLDDRATMTAAGLRAVVRRTSGVLALLTGVWTVLLVATGGFSVQILGLVVRSHNHIRPLIACVAAILVFFLTGGRSTLEAWVDRLPTWDLTIWRTGRAHDVVVGVLILLLLIISISNESTAAGGADSFGYLSQAELWREGRLSIPQRWAKEVPWPDALRSFTPHGYAMAPQAPRFTLGGYYPPFDPWSIVPVYSPGMPMLMAISKSIGGVCAPFHVVPIAGAIFVLFTYLIGIRLGSRTMALVATLFVATSPPFLLMDVVNMSDVPVAAAIVVGCWCVLGTTIGSAWGGAVALAAALLIRPNLVPLVPVFAGWLAWRIVRNRADWKRHAWRAAIVLGGIGVGMASTAALYWVIYGTPFESGYGPTAPYFSTNNIGQNFRNYVGWLVEAHTWVVFIGFVALAIPIKALWPGVTDRSTVVAFAAITAVVIAEFLAYLVFDNSSYLRFFLVFYPFIMLGLASVAMAMSRVHRLAGPVLAIALVVGLCANGLNVSKDWRVLDQDMIEAKYADVAEHVRHMTPENSVVLAGQHTGSLRYYAGRVTLRWDVLPEDWLDGAVAWMAERGVHTYALLEDFERGPAVKRFASQRLAAVLAGPPVFQFGNKTFFDLATPPGTIETTEFPFVDIPAKCLAPAPQPALVWKH